MISFGKLTKSTYEALTAPVQDRLYLIEDTGELLLNGKAYNGDDGTRDWLCFTNTYDGTNTVKITLSNNATAPSLEYSMDGENWTTLTFSSTESATISLEDGEKVYIRGDNPDYEYGQWSEQHGDMLVQFVLGQPSICTGSILSLFSRDCRYEGRVKINNLFAGCKIITAPKMPQTDEVYSYDYYSLFKNCQYLVAPPELPATTVGANAYKEMFYNCPRLLFAPKLPATTLGNNCYQQMFAGTAITEAPELPATTLAEYCYQGMFLYCQQLVKAQDRLPATTMAFHCYDSMFKNCFALKKPPVLPAYTLAEYCYSDMFNGSGLTEVCALPATNLAYSCYGGMFVGTKITTLPLNLLPATTLAGYCYQWMFSNCTSLTIGCRLPATTLTQNCYAHMYENCSSLTDSERISMATLASGSCYQMFRNCTKLCRLLVPALISWDESTTYQWMQGLSNLSRAFVCDSLLDTSTRNESRIPSGWIATRSAYGADALISRWNVSSNNFTFCPCDAEQDYLIISANDNYVYNAITLPSGYVGSAQGYVIWYPSYTSATLTAGTGLTFIDTPKVGYMSRVLVTWDGWGNAELRVMWEKQL